MRLTSMALGAGLLLMALETQAATLITESEAALPAAAGGVTMRGITRGPTVKLVNPAETKSPFDLKVKFQAHGGAAIEPGSVKVVYLKSPAVDITDADPALVRQLTAGDAGVQTGTQVAMNPDAVQRLRDRMAAIDARRAELRGGTP